MKKAGFLKSLFHADPEGSGMYAAREKVYPREIKGRFQTLRKLAVFVLLGLYYLLPWMNWDARQAVLFDLPARKFYVFGLVFWPQDFFYLALLLIIAALSLFFFTALAGRLWCGYACPQTVWTEVFIWMEQLAEGNRNQRMKLDKAPWTADKIRRKAFKHTMWIVFALWTGFTFVGYFTPIEELGVKIVNLDTGPWETFWVLFYAFATWGNAGFLREQVCIYMCPYARFQSAMFDKDTLVIAYDADRGEPRGGRRKSVPDVATREVLFSNIKVEHTHEKVTALTRPAATLSPRERGGSVATEIPSPVELGECIDCNISVQVCPTGIDIREGLQYECIACAACIDACDSVMDKMNYPRGLIRYSTQHAIDHKVTHVLRPRTLVYGFLLLTIIGLWIAGIALREPLAVDVLRDRNALYRIDDDDVENVYTLKIMNKDAEAHTYAISVNGLRDAGVEFDRHAIQAAPGEVLTLPVRVEVDVDGVKGGGQDIDFRVESDDGTVVIEQSRFFAPVER